MEKQRASGWQREEEGDGAISYFNPLGSQYEEGELLAQEEYRGISTPDSSSGEEGGGIRAVLPVAPITHNWSASTPPETGPEYLRLVRYQSQRLPDSVGLRDGEYERRFLSIDQLLHPTQPSNRHLASLRIPREEWRQSFVEEWSSNCASVEFFEREFPDDASCPKFGEKSDWLQFIYQRHASATSAIDESHPMANVNDDFESDVDTLICKINTQRQISQLIGFHSKWFASKELQFNWHSYTIILRLLQKLDKRTLSIHQTQKLVLLAKELVNKCLQPTTNKKNNVDVDSLDGKCNSALNDNGDSMKNAFDLEFCANGVLAVISDWFGQKNIWGTYREN